MSIESLAWLNFLRLLIAYEFADGIMVNASSGSRIREK
jgi:hypothetical protein